MHRDLKPSNIMLVSNIQGVILDFGSMTPALISVTTRNEAQIWQVVFRIDAKVPADFFSFQCFKTKISLISSIYTTVIYDIFPSFRQIHNLIFEEFLNTGERKTSRSDFRSVSSSKHFVIR